MIITSYVAEASASGFLVGLGFILSIGPQNLKLIESGIDGRHATIVATAGFLSEIVVALVGLTGIGLLLLQAPTVANTLRVAGLVFLLFCASTKFTASNGAACFRLRSDQTRRDAIRSMLIVTWLNPLVYVEVMLLVGALSTGYEPTARVGFGLGFLTASAIKFYGWSWAGRLLSTVLQQPMKRRLFDQFSGILLLAVAGTLAFQFLQFA